MEIPENEIHVYSVNSDKEQTDIGSFQSILSGDEKVKAERFRFEKDKVRYIIFRATLRNILAKYLNTSPSSISFSYTLKGKPYLSDSTVKFNLAHSLSLAVYAFTENDEIGIDTEYKKEMPDAFEIARRYFSELENTEFALLRKEDTAGAFFNCWTRKEAFIKAIGEGLSYPLKDFSVTFRQEYIPGITWIQNKNDEPGQWSLYDIDIDQDYVTSLAIRSKKKNIVIKNLKR